MKLFLRWQIQELLASHAAVPGVITNYAPVLAALKELEFDVSVDETLVAIGYPPHPDSIMQRPNSRGSAMIHAADIWMEGDDVKPEGYNEALNAWLISVGKDPLPLK